MNQTKIQLSKEELDLVKNSSWILTKNGVVHKIAQGFGELAVNMEAELKRSPVLFAEAINGSPAKISKGEKYQGLPYLVLDYPRIFSRGDILAIRTFFWWGKHCSITMHCRGRFKPLVSEGILRERSRFLSGAYYLATAGDEWVHDLQSAPHVPFDSLDRELLEQTLQNADFLRLGKLVQLDQWECMEEELATGFAELLQTLAVR